MHPTILFTLHFITLSLSHIHMVEETVWFCAHVLLIFLKMTDFCELQNLV